MVSWNISYEGDGSFLNKNAIEDEVNYEVEIQMSNHTWVKQPCDSESLILQDSGMYCKILLSNIQTELFKLENDKKIKLRLVALSNVKAKQSILVRH